MSILKTSLITLVSLFAVLWHGGGISMAQTVIPLPQNSSPGTGTFRITEETKLYTNLKGHEKERLTAYLSTIPAPFDKKFKGNKSPRENVIILQKSRDAASAPEGYSMEVTPAHILIRSTTDTGLFYGLQTLMQLAQPADGTSLEVASVKIEDAPRFDYRGLMIDVSRHFRSKEFVKKQIDAMARYKLNRLHLHLTDAAGWRIEIKKYPRLTDFAAWRPEANWKKWWFADNGRKYCNESDPKAQGGYYTQEDIRELVEYASERHNTIIPEIEMPAHSEEVLAAYPELSCPGEPYKSADFCVGNEDTFSFLEDVLTEVMELFPSEYIHVGGDEASKATWTTCPKCAKRMQDEKLKDVDALQGYLINRIEAFLSKHNRKLLGWDEIMNDSLAPNAAVMSWRGEEGGINAVRNGHRAIMTPGSYCYIDQYQDAPYSQPEAIGGYLPLSKIYSYNPIPEALTEEGSRLIYGVQANLWAEYIQTDEHYEHMLYPRLMALAEVGWSRPDRKSYAHFHSRALKEIEWLQSRGYHTFPLKDEIGNRHNASQPVSHLALGKPVKYNAPYNPNYQAQGDKTLTDGKRGGWTYSDGAWQGFISRDRLDVTIDLEAVTELRSISADFIQVVGPEVFLPREIIISVSSDGTDYNEVKRIEHETSTSEVFTFRNFGWEGDTSARYIRFQARADKTLGGWIFTDEIIVK